SNTTAKLPILKLGEYEMWVIRIKQYFQVYYAQWEVIDIVPATAEEKTNKKNDVKAKSLLLMALPNEHKLTFSQYSDAKTMFAAIETRFGGSRRLLVGLQFWMNKADIETMSIDDLYNNFKIVEQDVKKSVGASTDAQNMAFMTALSTSSINDVNIAKPAYEVCTVSPNDLEQLHEDDLEVIDLKWQLSLLSMRAKRYFQRTGKKIFINVNDTTGYDKSKVECFNYHKMGHFARECRAPRNKEGFDWSDMKEEQVQTNMAIMAFSDSGLLGSQITDKSKKGLGYNFVPPPHSLIYNRPKKLDLSYSGLDDSKENSDDSLVKEQVSEDTSSFVESSLNVDKETIFLVDKKIEFVKPKNHEKPVKKSVRLGVKTIKGKGWTVNTAYPKSIVFSTKPMSCFPKTEQSTGKTQQDDIGFVDSGCSRHMTGNIVVEFDGGYVTFGGGAHGGRISSKGTLKTDSLDFEDVYFVNELKFNLFIISLMCDKKSYVLFTNTELFRQVLMAKSEEVSLFGYSLSSKALGYINTEQEGTIINDLQIPQIKNSIQDVDKVEPKSAADEQTADGRCPDIVPDVNTGSFKLNIIDASVNTASSNGQEIPKDMFTMGASSTLKATHVEFFSDKDEPEVNLGNITNSYTVPTTPNTRIHKDHPIENVIGDVKSSVQTRRMTKPTSEQGFLSVVYEQKTHDTLNTCLYACFISQIEPTSIAKALFDSSWVEAMQEELLQFKLQQVLILVDLPIGKRAIGIKWVFRNKKDERGILY
ncbi:putative ribonuclease H-like domain-containing protein, partial [Tanacetum coccineum]